MEDKGEFFQPQSASVNGAEKQQKPNQSLKDRFLNRLRSGFLPKIAVDELRRSSTGKDIGMHKVSYEFFFSPHASPTDLKGLKERFDKADIYIPEIYGWTEETLSYIRGISKGKESINFSSEKKLSASAMGWVESLRIIYGSNKPIAFIDVPESKYENQQSEKLDWNGEFSDMLSSIKNSLRKNSDSRVKRERYMLDHLAPTISKLLDEYPLLKNKKELRVLLSLGFAHSPIFIDLAKSGAQTSMVFGQPYYHLTYSQQGERRLRFRDSIDDHLAAKIFMEVNVMGTFGKALDSVTEDTAKKIKVFRKLVDYFSFDETKAIFKVMKASGNNGGNLVDVVMAAVDKKGFNMPQSEKELDEFLAKQMPENPSSGNVS